jgi:selenocysteine lyase/cysteine desulfurase
MRTVHRRTFIGVAAAGAAAAGAVPFAFQQGVASAPGKWAEVRNAFGVDRRFIHLAGMLFASHPLSVRQAIDMHRRGFDANPAEYVNQNKQLFDAAVRGAAGRYLGARETDLILTDSTTMGIGLVYSGIDIRRGQEILTTVHDYPATHDAIAMKTRVTGASSRQITLYSDPARANAAEMVARLSAAIMPNTRVVALTWVHSSNGVKIPLKQIGAAIANANRGRSARERVLICVDGVHALGVEDFEVDDLGCDFLMAGTHKWLCGPRGTGFVWGRRAAQQSLAATIPTFTRNFGWGGDRSPGGFHSFEHRWALAEAFNWQLALGKAAVAARIRDLATRFKTALSELKNVRLKTPADPSVSAGIVAFEVEGLSSGDVERRLRSSGIIASQAPYSPSYARLSPGLLNHEGEIKPTVDAIAGLSS